MPLTLNIRNLKKKPFRLEGSIPLLELDMETRDELIKADSPLEYDIEAERFSEDILIRGRISMALNCDCVRCLKPFQIQVDLADWSCFLALSGEERTPVINDCIDLTPYIREDMLLAFPQHPLCEIECNGLPRETRGTTTLRNEIQPMEGRGSSVWAKLDKLEL